MGQKLSTQPNAPLVWILRGQGKMHPHPEQPIKFHYKTRRRTSSSTTATTTTTPPPAVVVANPAVNVPASVACNRPPATMRRAVSTPHLPATATSTTSATADGDVDDDDDDIDEFLATASLDRPANVPVVLTVASVLYQTRAGGYQAEVALPLGAVVNAVFRNERWLYAQTPHGEEGYVARAACIPLGIRPTATASIAAAADCWDTSTDVFPRPSGNLGGGGGSSRRRTTRRPRRRRHQQHSAGGGSSERSVDQLYLRASGGGTRRHTLLVIAEDYERADDDDAMTMTVRRGDVVALLSAHLRDWFLVRRKEGEEGFIPAAVAGYGYL